MRFLVVAVAVSGGGIEDLKTLFAALPPEADLAFIVVAPLQRNRESKLADIVRHVCILPVIKVDNDVNLQPGHVYVISENTVLSLEDEVLLMRTRKLHEIVNTSIRDLYVSLGKNLGRRAVAVVLGGMGDSATEGAKVIGEHGGYVITKEPDPLSDSGMTKDVIENDSPNVILPVEDIVPHLLMLAVRGC